MKLSNLPPGVTDRMIEEQAGAYNDGDGDEYQPDESALKAEADAREELEEKRRLREDPDDTECSRVGVRCHVDYGTGCMIFCSKHDPEAL